MKQLWDGTDKCDFKNGVIYTYHRRMLSGSMVWYMPRMCLQFTDYVIENPDDYKSEPVVIYITTELCIENTKDRFRYHAHEVIRYSMWKDVFDVIDIRCSNHDKLKHDIDDIIKDVEEKGKNVIGIFIDKIEDTPETSNCYTLAKLSVEKDIPVVIGEPETRFENDFVKVPASCVNDSRLLYTRKSAYDICTESM